MRKAGCAGEGGERRKPEAPLPGTTSLKEMVARQLVETKGVCVSTALSKGDSQ